MILNQARVDQVKRMFKVLGKITNEDILKVSDEASRGAIHKVGKDVSSYGYPLPSNLKVKDLITLLEIIKKPPNEANEELNVFMTNHFNEKRIQKMLKELNDLEKPNFNQKRKRILTEALQAHMQGMYHVAVPTLLAQLEGIIVDAHGLDKEGNRKKYNIKDIIHFSKQTKLVKNLLAQDSKKFNEKQTLNYKNQDRNHPTNAFNDVLSDYYENLIIVTFNHGQSGSESVSRHGVLHGANVDYGTQETSLKIILFTDLLIKKIVTAEPHELENYLPNVFGNG